MDHLIFMEPLEVLMMQMIQILIYKTITKFRIFLMDSSTTFILLNALQIFINSLLIIIKQMLNF